MAGFMESVATVNSALRTLLAFVLVSILGIGGWFGYTKYNAADIELREKDREIEERNKRISALEGDLEIAKKRAEKLEIAVRLLKVDHRLANVDVVKQMVGIDGKTYTDVTFTEVNDKNEAIADPQEFRLPGKAFHIAGWIVKFEDRFVETGDPERGTSLFAFKSIYGNEQKPIDGFPLDKPGKRPDAYGKGREVSSFEQDIWDDFWNLAHDKARKEALGVRSSHGAAVFIEDARPGWRYQVRLRSSGDLTLEQQGQSPAKPSNTAL
jgi:hypothetical protein